MDEVIARFDWECIHEAPKKLATANAGAKSLNLKYMNSDNSLYSTSNGYQYNVTTLDVNADLTLETLLTNGYFDSEYSTRAEEIALSTQLRNLRDQIGQPGAEEKVIVVSNGQRVEVYPASQYDTLIVNGTSAKDTINISRARGVFKSITVNTEGGNDLVVLNPVDVADGSAVTSIAINAGTGDDNVIVDSSVFLELAVQHRRRRRGPNQHRRRQCGVLRNVDRWRSR